uniref:ATP-dependent DNA helicase n=1 Tax=Tanacetum cinerariifolium TaxID=118510 RepID=A0A6L2KQU1_TANCI|nr:helicase [Tanacetum cinerariifolium]
MKEYHAYIIQQQNDQGTTLLRGGRLFQQYLVEAFTTVEEQRLKWSRNNQDTMRADLYHNVCDAVIRGDTNAEGLDKRIVLDGTFTGGPRYMMSNYQDAMALCRTYENPDMFITFTSNPKWPEIAEMLSYLPGQKPHDRPEVGTHVFKLKLTQLLEDLKKKIFGDCRGVIYVIEFQKRGLPHVHILLWLEEHSKCSTLAQIDDIISADILSQAKDPEGYKARRNRKNIFYKTIMARLRSERMIGLAVASSGIVSLLLPCGRMAHSRFVIPLELMENNTCGTKQNAHLAKLMQQVQLIIYDEAPMTQKYAFETLDKMLRDVLCCWRWYRAGQKKGEDEATWIEIPERFLIKAWTNPIEQIVQETYPDFTTRQYDDDYLKERAILNPRKDDADAINTYMFKKLAGDTVT